MYCQAAPMQYDAINGRRCIGSRTEGLVPGAGTVRRITGFLLYQKQLDPNTLLAAQATTRQQRPCRIYLTPTTYGQLLSLASYSYGLIRPNTSIACKGYRGVQSTAHLIIWIGSYQAISSLRISVLASCLHSMHTGRAALSRYSIVPIENLPI